MATISKKQNKNGLVFKIQVKIKDKGSGKIITKTTTFKPPEGLNSTQMLRQATVYADEYEMQIKGLSNGLNRQLEISPETTFKEYAEKWIESGMQDKSLSYYANNIYAKRLFDEYIGGYKLKELNPVVIQNFYNILDRREKITHKITAKATLASTMKAKGVRYTDLRYTHKIATTSLNLMLRGGSIGIDNAERIAKALGVQVKSIFNIETTVEKYAFETINKVKRTVRAILAQAKKQRLIVDNWASADYINFPKRPTKTIEFLNDEQSKQFYATVSKLDDIRIRTALTLLLFTGVRRGELCGLEWQDVDLENKTLKIRQSVVAVTGFGAVTKEPKTATSKRTLSISNLLVECLAEYKAWYDKMSVDLGDAWVHSDRLLVQWNGSPLNPGTVGHWLDKALEQAGLQHVKVHSLRHTCITLQIAAGVPLVTVANRAGHARTSTTTDIYSHLLKSSDRQAADALDDMFGE